MKGISRRLLSVYLVFGLATCAPSGNAGDNFALDVTDALGPIVQEGPASLSELRKLELTFNVSLVGENKVDEVSLGTFTVDFVWHKLTNGKKLRVFTGNLPPGTYIGIKVGILAGRIGIGDIEESLPVANAAQTLALSPPLEIHTRSILTKDALNERTVDFGLSSVTKLDTMTQSQVPLFPSKAEAATQESYWVMKVEQALKYEVVQTKEMAVMEQALLIEEAPAITPYAWEAKIAVADPNATGSISGVVTYTDTNGNPIAIAGAAVHLYNDPEWYPFDHTAMTDKNGFYKIVGLDLTPKYNVGVYQQGYSAGWNDSPLTVMAGETTRFDAKLTTVAALQPVEAVQAVLVGP